MSELKPAASLSLGEQGSAPSALLALGLISAPVGIYLLGFYGQERVSSAPELELISVNLSLLLLILFPRLRSRLLRRRVWVRAWISGGHWLRGLLRGGALYLALQLLFVTPLALLLLVELQHFSPEMWERLSLLAGACGAARLLAHRRMKRVFTRGAASVLSRELGVYLFFMGASALLLNETLYLVRPDFSKHTLQEALLMTAKSLPPQGGGFLNRLVFLSAMKETTFWWTATQLPIALKGLPSGVVTLAESGVMSLYALYQLSILFALSQALAGLLEVVDPEFYRFLKSQKPLPNKVKSAQALAQSPLEPPPSCSERSTHESNSPPTLGEDDE